MTDRNSIETLKLYQNPKLYNGSRYKVFQDNINYESWLANNSDGYDTFEVTYQSISQPITLGFSLPEMDSYTYGSITNAGKTYYFFVDTIQTDQFQMTTIEFTVDWWSTYWSQATCTKAHISRSPTKPGYQSQPYTPMNTSITQSTLTSNYVIMATYIPNNEDEPSFICNIILEGTPYNLKLVEQGYWYQKFNIPGADIKDCFIVPLFSYSDFTVASPLFMVNTQDVSGVDISSKIWTSINDNFDSSSVVSGAYPVSGSIAWDVYSNKYYVATVDTSQLKWVETTDPTINDEYKEIYLTSDTNNLYKMKMTNLSEDGTVFPIKTKNVISTFTTTETDIQGICDWNGNTVWECPFGITITGFTATLLIGISHVMVQCEPITDAKIGNLLTGKAFTYDCRHPGLFVDSYQDYVLKNRDYDIAMRQIQSDKQYWTSVSSLFENIGFGYAFGEGKGALAAGIGGVIETIGTYAINSTFDPQIQQQYDNLYERMTDQISLVGDSVTELFIQSPFIKYTLSMDEDTRLRYITDVRLNGYYCDETVADLQSTFTNQTTTAGGIIYLPVFQADNITVEGSVPLACKQQIVRRLQNGVEFI